MNRGMPIVSIRQLHFPIELSESDFSLFHLVNQVFQIISKDDTEVGTLSKCNHPSKNCFIIHNLKKKLRRTQQLTFSKMFFYSYETGVLSL